MAEDDDKNDDEEEDDDDDDGTHASRVCSVFSTPHSWEASCMRLR